MTRRRRRMRRRKRRSTARVVILVLIVILLAASAVLYSRFTDLKFDIHTIPETFATITNQITKLFSKQDKEAISVPEPTPVPTPEPVFVKDFPLQKDREIPIVSYYSVSDDQGMEQYLVGSERVSPDDFEEQLKYIRDNGFTTITFEDLADLANISKPVMLTFDGCWKDLYTVVYPRIQQYNTKINIFVWPDYLGTGGHITEEQLKEMATSDLVSVNAGIEVYKPTDSVKQDELFASIDKAKKYVTELVGHEPLAFAYPVGGITAGAQQHCSSEFRFCVRRSAERPYNTTIDDGSIIYRYTIQRGTPVAMLAYWLSRSN